MATKRIVTGRLVGAETIIGDLTRYSDTIRARLKDAVEVSARELVARARARAPVKTGALRSSITGEGEQTEKRMLMRVGTPVFYGRFLESGWTPNPRKKTDTTWKRNPRKAKDWNDYAKQRGGRRIVSHPFLKPSIAAMRTTIRERLLLAVRGA
jgi:hypothetical protein